ncbi:carbohydrate-binding module family 20 domain-containing protein [Candidatus Finniella inopinata]|uniref:CBM20 domain-containing protein n=1 Tax=Candidatus Finniella inopinata TaxID=1696036 RepID=A0A4Q7DHL2_9PROT|nr:carbohydrate-binding module family 20 domain-containing protein [Candidatus Finniella inopinata]RZI46421.1 hypothetical protein EQU50_02190 [Candidatus Finniella inopinata]
MFINKIIQNLLLVSALGASAYATGAQSVSGPTFLFKGNGPLDGSGGAANPPRPRAILHAFDLSLTTITRPETFKPDDSTPSAFTASKMDPISNSFIDRASNRGYSHIQISATQYNPTVYNVWSEAYRPLVMILDDPQATSTSPSYNSRQAYLNTVKDALTSASGSTSNLIDLKKYGATIPDTANSGKYITVGYMLQSALYGGLTDLLPLINYAKAKNIGFVADVVFNQVDDFMKELKDKSKPSTSLFTLRPAYINGYTPQLDTTRVFPTDAKGNGFFTPSSSSSWNYGPQFNLSNSYVQDMIVGYLQFLYDIGIAGIRIDYLSATSPGNWQIILQKAYNKGVTFNLGYGEKFDSWLPSISPYAQIMPLEDFTLQQNSLGTSCINNLNNGSISSLVMPNALGNTQSAVNFTVIHDMFPNIGGSRFWFYGGFNQQGQDSNHSYTSDKNMIHVPNPTNVSSCTICAAQRTNPALIINSQLGNAYLLAKRDGSPLIIRFEDEAGNLSGTSATATGDFADIIKNALAFRTAMDAKNAPHEYMVALDRKTLLIARQFGFAVINVGLNNRTIALSDLQKVPSAYIPDTSYTSANTTGSYYIDLADTNTPPAKYTKTSSGFKTGATNATASSRNVKYFVLQNPPTSMSSRSVVFEAKNANTSSFGQQLFVLGNHPLLGNWSARPDFLNIMMNLSSTGNMYPKWQTIPISFPSEYSVSYKFAKGTVDDNQQRTINEWEPGNNRTLNVNAGSDLQYEWRNYGS